MSNIYILHENNEWTAPLCSEMESLELPFKEWFLNQGILDITKAPPDGVFYNRMSASSHTRNHRYAAEYTAVVLVWLESHNRRVLNTSRALQLEVSKIAQYTALTANGIRTPRTVAAIGKEQIIGAAQTFNGPFITKHNRGGKGLGVQLFQSIDALNQHVNGSDFEHPIDGITLVQEYIEPPEPYITRCEFIGGKFIYAVRVDTSEGFQLCPADVCQISDDFCPASSFEKPKFKIIEGFEHPILEKYAIFLEANGIHIAGIEFIFDKQGEVFTYDVNTNTNYNADTESEAGIFGMKEIAKYLGTELEKLKI